MSWVRIPSPAPSPGLQGRAVVGHSPSVAQPSFGSPSWLPKAVGAAARVRRQSGPSLEAAATDDPRLRTSEEPDVLVAVSTRSGTNCRRMARSKRDARAASRRSDAATARSRSANLASASQTASGQLSVPRRARLFPCLTRRSFQHRAWVHALVTQSSRSLHPRYPPSTIRGSGSARMTLGPTTLVRGCPR